VTDDTKIATHAEPVRRGRTNFIVRLDLADHGMRGCYEQMWTRTEDQHLFELCCIPFFTYGQSLGDILEVTLGTGRHRVHAKGGHRTIRFNFTNRQPAQVLHNNLHAALVGQLGCLVEFGSPRYGAIDLDISTDARAVVALLDPLHQAGNLIWEMGGPGGDLTGACQKRGPVTGDGRKMQESKPGSEPGMARSVSGGAPPPSRAPEDRFLTASQK
jgi:hypothetical protein